MPSRRRPRSPAPDPAVWLPLLDAADRLRDVAPWGWMADTPAFGIHDQESGTTSTCCVLGAGGEVFGLCLFDGPDSRADYARMQEGTGDPLDMSFEQHSLTLFFERRADLRPEMHALLKTLGRKPGRGRHAWPEATVHRPGHEPRLPDAAEATLMTRLVAEAIPLCERVRESPKLLDGAFLVRRGGRDTHPSLPRRRAPAPLRPAPPLDSVTAARLGRAPRVGGAWLGDHFFMPAAILDREHPYYPRQVTWVDPRTTMVLDVHLMPPEADAALALRERSVQLLLDRSLPDLVVVRRAEAAAVLAPLAPFLEILHDPDPAPFLQLKALFDGFHARGRPGAVRGVSRHVRLVGPACRFCLSRRPGSGHPTDVEPHLRGSPAPAASVPHRSGPPRGEARRAWPIPHSGLAWIETGASTTCIVDEAAQARRLPASDAGSIAPAPMPRASPTSTPSPSRSWAC